MTKSKRINASKLGFRDLDEADVANALCLSITDIPSSVQLDLRECFLDYGPCSQVVDTVLEKLAVMDGRKSLLIETLVDLGSVESMTLLLARNAEHVIGQQREKGEVRGALFEYCREKDIEFFVDIYTVEHRGSGFDYKKVRRYDLSAPPIEGDER